MKRFKWSFSLWKYKNVIPNTISLVIQNIKKPNEESNYLLACHVFGYICVDLSNNENKHFEKVQSLFKFY